MKQERAYRSGGVNGVHLGDGGNAGREDVDGDLSVWAARASNWSWDSGDSVGSRGTRNWADGGVESNNIGDSGRAVASWTVGDSCSAAGDGAEAGGVNGRGGHWTGSTRDDTRALDRVGSDSASASSGSGADLGQSVHMDRDLRARSNSQWCNRQQRW